MKFEEDMAQFVHHKATRNLSTGTPKSRMIEYEILAKLIWLYLVGLLFERRHYQTRADAIVIMVFEHLLVTYPHLFYLPVLKACREFMRQYVWNAWKIQKAIDLSPCGGLNYSGIESLRTVEELDKWERGCLPSESTIRRSAKALEEYALSLGLEINVKATEYGNVYYFDPATLLRIIVEEHGMTEIAREGSNEKPMLLSVTIDGALLTADLKHITFGLKKADVRMVNALTGIIDPDFQNRDNQWPFGTAFGPECTGIYDEGIAKVFFDFFCSGEVVCPEDGPDKPRLSNFQVVSPQDMSSHWKTVGLGSASGNLPCLCCMVDREDKKKYKTGDDMCLWCTKNEAIQAGVQRCYCMPVNDEERLQDLQELISANVEDSILELYTHMDLVRRKSTIETDPNIVGKYDRGKHIDFRPVGRKQEREFGKLINKELMLRLEDTNPELLSNILVLDDYDDRRNRLKDFVAQEGRMWEARSTLNRQERVKWFTVEQVIPCILHLKMRLMEKLYHQLLSQAYERYGPGDAKTRRSFKLGVERYMNEQVVGTATSPGHWKFPATTKAKKGGAVKLLKKGLTGRQAKKVLHGMKGVASFVFSSAFDEESDSVENTRMDNAILETQWHDLMDTTIPLLEAMDRTEDWTDEQIWSFHALCSLFMTRYCDLNLGEGITNYVHVIGAGHLTYYLLQYRNLSRFQQQGWEAMNQLVKSFYFNNTNHGGSGGNSKGRMEKGEHCVPLMRLHMRRIMWLTGKADEFFLNGPPEFDSDSDEMENPNVI